MKIQVNKNTLPRVHGAEVLIEFSASSGSTILCTGTWDDESQVFKYRFRSEEENKNIKKPSEVVAWWYYSDRYIAPRKTNPDPLVLIDDVANIEFPEALTETDNRTAEL